MLFWVKSISMDVCSLMIIWKFFGGYVILWVSLFCLWEVRPVTRGAAKWWTNGFIIRTCCHGQLKSTIEVNTGFDYIYLYHLRGKTASWPLRLVVLPSKGKSQFTSILLLLSFPSTKLVFSISEGTAINLSKASKLLSVCSRFLRAIQHQRWAKQYLIFHSISQLFPIGHLDICNIGSLAKPSIDSFFIFVEFSFFLGPRSANGFLIS